MCVCVCARARAKMQKPRIISLWGIQNCFKKRGKDSRNSKKTLRDGHVTTKSLSTKPQNTNSMNKHNMKDKVESTSEIKVHAVA